MNDLSAEQIRIWTRKISESDREAFERLFRAMYPRLIRFAHKYVRSKAAATDIVQDTFVILWEKRTEADPERSLKAYLYTTVRNRSLNYIRDHSDKTLSLNNIPDKEYKKEVSLNTNDKSDQLLSYLHSWIKELPKRQREAFELSRFEGLDHDEIAKVMDISSNTVNNHIVAALRNLKSSYSKHKNEAN